jgi:hypothetical protein
MREVSDVERSVTRLNRALTINLTYAERCRLGGWGEADFGWEADRGHVAAEVETSQHHPSTNVLKFWPWLLENPTARVFLLHVYQPGSRQDSSRQRLAQWVGERMERSLRGRFVYGRIRMADRLDPATVDSLRARLQSFLTDGAKL